MERDTHSRRSVGRRVTRKRNHNQKGAGQVVDVTTVKYFSGEYIPKWTAGLTAEGVTTEDAAQIVSLFAYKPATTTTPPTPPTNATTPPTNATTPPTNATTPPTNATTPLSPPTPPTNASTTVDDNKYVDAWLLAHKYQDVILRTGLNIIKDDIKITSDADVNTIPENDTTKIRDMFTNLIPVIFFKEDLPFEAAIAPDTDSKFELMFKAPVPSKEIKELLLYPKRIENLLVQSVAEIIVMLSKDNELQKIVSKLDEFTRPLLIDKWSIFSRGFCTIQINKFEIRDNFPTCREPIQQDMVTSFWTQVIIGMQSDISEKIVLPTEGDDTKKLNDALGLLSGCYAKWYCAGKQDDFYSILGVTSSNLVSGTALDPNNMLDAPQIGAKNLITSATLGGIFDKLLVQTVTYLKHLEGSVECIAAKSKGTST